MIVTQSDLFGNPALDRMRESERDKGNRIVAALTGRPDRADYLSRVRAAMRRLYRARYADVGERAVVTPDDARRVFEAMGPPRSMSRNFLGGVFRERGWEIVGTYASETPGSHGNRLNQYAWRGE